MRKGLFITFEGLDGTGKTTQIMELEKKLQQLNLSYITTREPGGTPIAEKIREIILDPENTEMSSQTEALLYAASRAQHVSETISPALQNNQVVICDRYFDSTLAYQGYARELTLEALYQMNEFAMQGIKPDLTFLLDTDTQAASGRMHDKQMDRLDLEADFFKKRVRAGFLKIADFEKERIKVINAALSVEQIHEAVWDYTKEALQNKGLV